MKAYRFDVGPYDAILIGIVVLILALSILWFVPGLKRKVEQGRSERLSLRVTTVCRKGVLYSTEILTRLTVYNDRLVWCFFTLNEFEFRYIKVHPYQVGSPLLRLSVHGISVKVWGVPGSLKRLFELLELETRKSARKRTSRFYPKNESTSPEFPK